MKNRTPLIFIHGWNAFGGHAAPTPEGWDNLLTALYPPQNAPTVVRSRFKPYYFNYFSNDVSVSALGSALEQVIDAASADSFPDGLGSKPIVIVAHSMGGLVARSFMQEQTLTTGSYSGQLGYSRVLNLLTLATPHNGSPLASVDAMDDVVGLRDVVPFEIWEGFADCQGLRSTTLPPSPLCPNMRSISILQEPTLFPNLSDLTWDNHDSFFNTHPEQWNDWLFHLNNLWRNLTNGNPAIGQTIIAYGNSWTTNAGCDTSISVNSDIAACGHRLLTDAMGTPNDGLVPSSSSWFDNVLPLAQQRDVNVLLSDPTGYNHFEMATGKTSDANDPLFTLIAQDLANIALPSATATATPTATATATATGCGRGEGNRRRDEGASRELGGRDAGSCGRSGRNGGESRARQRRAARRR